MKQLGNDFIILQKIKDGWYATIKRKCFFTTKREILKWLKEKGFTILYKSDTLIRGECK